MSNIKSIFQLSETAQAIQDNSSLILDVLLSSYRQLILNLVGKSKGTKTAYLSNVKGFIAYIEVNGFYPTTFEQYREALALDLCSVSTKNARLAATSALLKAAYRARILPVDVTVGIPGFKVSRGHKKTGLSTNQVKEATKAIQAQKRESTRLKAHAMFTLMAFEGFRQSELTHLLVSDINLSENYVLVLGKGKHDKQKFPITSQTSSALRAWIEYKGYQEGYVFRGNKTGETITTAAIRKLFAGIFDIAGIEGKGVHGLRHWSITETLKATGGDLAKTRRRSRHTSFDMLIVYDDERIGQSDAANFSDYISSIV